MHYRLLIVVLLASLVKQSEPIKVKARVVVEKFAGKNQFPWYVLLKKSPYSKSICGGSLISPSWVLTAADCLKYSKSVFVMLGTVSRYNEKALNMTSTVFYKHSYYAAALIKLPQAVKFTRTIQPIALAPSSYDYSSFSKLGEIAGFGAKGDKYILKETLDLKFIQVKLVDVVKCDSWEEDEYVCAERSKSSGAVCDGDMGGPLIIRDSNGKPIQIAIITSIPKFCDWPTPLLYFQVKPILKWISDLTKINIE